MRQGQDSAGFGVPSTSAWEGDTRSDEQATVGSCKESHASQDAGEGVLVSLHISTILQPCGSLVDGGRHKPNQVLRPWPVHVQGEPAKKLQRQGRQRLVAFRGGSNGSIRVLHPSPSQRQVSPPGHGHGGCHHMQQPPQSHA